jgi:hypothetical protein
MVDYDIPVNWVNQQNQSFVSIDKPPIIGNIDFFYTEVVPHFGNDTVIYYYQDITNLTTVANCVNGWDDIHMKCKVVASYAHNSRIKSFSTALFTQDIDFWKYYYIFNFETNPNTVMIIDFFRHTRIAAI